MNELEAEVIDWFVSRTGADAALREQLRRAKISAREFSSGGGVFLSLVFLDGDPAPREDSSSYIDGPEIRSPEMAAGALVTLHLENGVASSFEIWSYAGDYPLDDHPKHFILVEPQGNNIDLR
jgi:hypothetical protein